MSVVITILLGGWLTIALRRVYGESLAPALAKAAALVGVLFVTLEDETGNVNVIVWPSLLEQQRREVMSARLLGVYGQWQCANNVRHLVAKRLVDLSHLLGELDTRSRNFH